MDNDSSSKSRYILDYSFLFIIGIGILIVLLGLMNVPFRAVLFNNFTSLILGYLALIIFSYDLSIKRKMHREELDFQKKLHEEAVAEREEQKQFEKRQQNGLMEIAGSIAEKVAHKLMKDNQWAFDALERAKLGIRAQSIFAERLTHFKEEKEHIAREFIPLLLERCKYLIEEKGKKVFLVIDSGTTLYPLFEELAKKTVRLKENGDAWLSKITLVTNNISGLEILLETGRINPNNRYSDLAIQCHLLPGMPLPIYSAVLGEKTEKALKNLRKEAKKDNPVFIGLITGNWIRLRRTQPVCPIPLARVLGHLNFKKILIAESDEIYVLAPLGKIFVDVDYQTVNEALKFDESNKDPDGKPYSEVNIDNEKAKIVKLVSTKRTPKNALYRHSTKITDILDARDISKISCSFINGDIIQVPHLLFPFDYNQEYTSLELEKEFPHKSTQRDEFMQKFFSYPKES